MMNQNLPEEIILNIFSRLPAKSVGICRCLSKTWRALLSRPDFIKTHLNHSTINPQLSLTYSFFGIGPVYSASLSNARHRLDKIKLPPAKQISPSWHGVFNSCNGLLLVYKSRNLFLVNPVTEEVREIPNSSLHFPDFLYSTFGTILLGYDSVHDDYKVVVVCYNCTALDDRCYHMDKDRNSQGLVSVYSLKNGSWKRIPSHPEYQISSKRRLAVHVGGCIHWFAQRMTDQKPVIMGFNLADERFYEIEVPLPNNSIRGHELDVVGGCLCVWDNQFIDIWVMKEYGVRESWTKFTIDHPEQPYGLRIVCSFGQEVVIQYISERFAMYNLKTRTSKYLEFPTYGRSFCFKGSFVESLVPSSHLNAK